MFLKDRSLQRIRLFRISYLNLQFNVTEEFRGFSYENVVDRFGRIISEEFI
jgi:hypothetical protein